MSFKFTNKSVPQPSHDQLPHIIQAASTLIDSVSERHWKIVSTTTTLPDVKTTTYRRAIDSETWFARKSEVPDSVLKFEYFRNGLLKNHSPNEKEYIHAITSAIQISSDSGTSSDTAGSSRLEVWSMKYHLPWPTTDREFVESIITHDVSETEFLVISIATVHPVQKDYVRATYTSIERVRKVKGPRDVDVNQWSMCTTSSPGGNIPAWIANRETPKAIAKDVPSFITWAQNHQSR